MLEHILFCVVCLWFEVIAFKILFGKRFGKEKKRKIKKRQTPALISAWASGRGPAVPPLSPLASAQGVAQPNPPAPPHLGPRRGPAFPLRAPPPSHSV